MDTDLDKTKDKDAELARWREQALQEDATANALRDQVASLTSLVRELADALDYARSCLAEYTYPSDESGKLVAKAREVVNG